MSKTSKRRLLAGAPEWSQQRLWRWLKEEGGRNAALLHVLSPGDHTMSTLREASSAHEEVEELAQEHGGDAGAAARELQKVIVDLDLKATWRLSRMD